MVGVCTHIHTRTHTHVYLIVIYYERVHSRAHTHFCVCKGAPLMHRHICTERERHTHIIPTLRRKLHTHTLTHTRTDATPTQTTHTHTHTTHARVPLRRKLHTYTFTPHTHMCYSDANYTHTPSLYTYTLTIHIHPHTHAQVLLRRKLGPPLCTPSIWNKKEGVSIPQEEATVCLKVRSPQDGARVFHPVCVRSGWWWKGVVLVVFSLLTLACSLALSC